MKGQITMLSDARNNGLDVGGFSELPLMGSSFVEARWIGAG
jgi:hypothetical protein